MLLAKTARGERSTPAVGRIQFRALFFSLYERWFPAWNRAPRPASDCW